MMGGGYAPEEYQLGAGKHDQESGEQETEYTTQLTTLDQLMS